MGRTIPLFSFVAVTLLALVAVQLGPGAIAEGSAGPTSATHPLVGAWRLDTNANDPANLPSLAIFHDDNTYLEIDADGGTGVGAWEATGDRTATLTIVFNQAQGAQAGSQTVRATVEVAPDGQTLAADYTLEFAQSGGQSSGQLGPGRATGERIVVEAPGTPIASLAEAFGTPTP